MYSNSLPQKAEENHGNNVLPIMCASHVALVKSETKWKVEKNIVLPYFSGIHAAEMRQIHME